MPDRVPDGCAGCGLGRQHGWTCRAKWRKAPDSTISLASLDAHPSPTRESGSKVNSVLQEEHLTTRKYLGASSSGARRRRSAQEMMSLCSMGMLTFDNTHAPDCR